MSDRRYEILQQRPAADQNDTDNCQAVTPVDRYAAGGHDHDRHGTDQGRVEEAPHGLDRSLTEAIEATTRGGRLVFRVFGALGQFERDLIQERSRAGLAAAAARGRKGERKPAITDEKLKRARAIIASGSIVRRGRGAVESRQDPMRALRRW